MRQENELDSPATIAEPASATLRTVWSDPLVKVSVGAVAVGYLIYAIVAPQIDALADTVVDDFLVELTRAPLFLLLAWLIYKITQRRTLPDYAERAPDASAAKFELVAIAAYTVGAMIILGALGITYHPQENDPALSQSDMIWWAIVNPIVYGLVPYLWLRSRGSSNRDLGLRGNAWRLDWKLLVAIGGTDMVLAIALRDFLDLDPGQMLTAAPLTLVLYGLGAGIPVVILTQAVVAPRAYAMTGSYISAGAACTIAYALFSSTDQGLIYDGAGHAVMAFLFITVVNFGPGLVKAMLTVRTGNVWLHFIAYHVVSFHMWADAPLVARIFEL